MTFFLEIFHDSFIDHLFDLVEQTRHMHDDSFNYSVIKLIVSHHPKFIALPFMFPSGFSQ